MMQISLECTIILSLNANCKSYFGSSTSTINGRFFFLPHFVGLQVLKMKTCRIGCCGSHFQWWHCTRWEAVRKGLEIEISRCSTNCQAAQNFSQLDIFCWTFHFGLNSFLYPCAEFLFSSHLQDLI